MRLVLKGGRTFAMSEGATFLPSRDVGLKGTRSEAANDNEAEHGAMLRSAIRW